MKKPHPLSAPAAFFLIIIWASAALIAQIPDRYFDRAAEPHSGIRLTILYPSTGTLRAIEGLKAQNLLPGGTFEIVGVYHARERTNYDEAKRLVREDNLSWIKFHEVASDLAPETLFQPNAASREFEEIFRKSDGIIFFGGPDIPPSLFGEKTDLLTVIEDPWRHYFELSFIFHLLGGSQNGSFRGLLDKRPDFPVLAICLGCQTLNVGTGGTLVQDIWTQVYGKTSVEDVIALGLPNWHFNPWRKLRPDEKALFPYAMHPIKLGDRSKFCAAMGFTPSDQPSIMSSHHQAVGKLGKGLVAAATSLDGRVVEAVEHSAFPNVLGTQFHPEFPSIWDPTPKYKLTPEDKDLVSINGILKAHPPSLEFGRKLWTWFFGKMK